ncbi:MAG TPA: CBS domain-containing protein [Candidatus Obscuribacterales bacterium]
MYEKNIVGVYNFLSEFPIHQHTVRDDKRIDPVNYAAQRPHTPGATRGEIDPHDAQDQWQEFSEHLRDQHGHGQESESDEQDPQAEQHARHAKTRQQGQPGSAQLDAGHQVDHMIEERVKAHISPAPMVQALKHHLFRVTQALPDQHHSLLEIESGHDPADALTSLRMRHVMTRKVVCVLDTVTLEQAASVCNRRGISGLPVLSADKKLLGVLSIRDVIRDLFTPNARQLARPNGAILESEALAVLHEPVSLHMTSKVITASPDTPLKEACQIMTHHRIRRLIITQDDQIKGIFSAQDAVRILAVAKLQVS